MENAAAVEMLRAIPGVQGFKLKRVLSRVEDMQEFVKMSLKEMEELLGEEDGRRAWEFVNRDKRVPLVMPPRKLYRQVQVGGGAVAGAGAGVGEEADGGARGQVDQQQDQERDRAKALALAAEERAAEAEMEAEAAGLAGQVGGAAGEGADGGGDGFEMV